MLNTIGLEIEVNDIPFDLARNFTPEGWETHDDGSNRSYRTRIKNMRVGRVAPFLEQYVDRVKYGAEFVSPPVELDGSGYSRVFRDVSTILRQVQDYGEQISDLTSIHVHVNSGVPPLYVMRNLIWLWGALEAPLYRLAVAEHEQHRGTLHNSYMYCRPLSHPQLVKGDTGTWYHAFDLSKLMVNAETTKEFVKGMCRADVQPNKWQPFRYYGVNFGNYFNARQTTEFRIFNQTLQVGVIRAWVELCVAFIKVAYMDRIVSNLSPFPLGATEPMGGKRFRFDNLMEIIPVSLMSQDAWSTLERLWNSTSWQKGCEDQLNHLCRTQGRTVRIEGISKDLRPEPVKEQIVESLWDAFDFSDH